MNRLVTRNLVDSSRTIAKELFDKTTYPWEVLSEVENFIYSYSKELDESYTKLEGKDVWVGQGTTISDNVLIDGPTIIGKNCEIRHGAYIRGKAVIGDSVVIGNSSEIKNAIIFDNAQVPHFNYVGDSVLGYKAHIGAGVKLSNLKSDKTLISIVVEGVKYETSLKKMGAVIGDNVEVGCNAVLNPGTVIGRDSNIYPLTFVKGFIPEAHILKNTGELIKKI